ncbi:MAG TPA: hypothetical protein ENI23_00955 [bacterium]|nr:hypothetical protein [bacterium]
MAEIGRKKYTKKQVAEQSARMKKKWTCPHYRKSQCLALKNGDTGGHNKGIKMPQIAGENSPHWKGGATRESQKARNSFRYKSWRLAVFERDNYTCRGCGNRGVYLEAHHIKSFAEHKDLRFVVDNGMTYCIKCHCKNDKVRNRTLRKLRIDL